MYEERRERFSFRSFFLTLLLVLLFVFLMLWLFPNKWDLKNMHVYENQSSYDIDRLSVLYNEIFANNVERMKDAAISYYTTERLPKNVGDSKKLTLREMYDLHLVLKMRDKDGKECDVEKSYVKITKYEEEYRLKVNLSCGSDEDYIIVYLGCYSYCPSGVCEKKVTTSGNSGKVSTPDTPTKTVYSCKVVDGKYYNKSGNVVSKEDYEKSCVEPEEEKHVCEIANGKYYDKNGKVVSESEYKKSCETSEKYSCKVVDGKYYDKDGKVVSKEEYNKSCIEPEKKYSCEVVNGKYYDKDGNVVSKADYEKSCLEPERLMYEYKLEIPSKTTCNDWSKWQKTEVKATDTRQVETKVEHEIIDYRTVTIQTGVKKEIKEVQEKYITGYTTKLVFVGTKQVKVGTTTKEVTEKVAVGTVRVFAGVGSGTRVPKDTDTRVYEVISQEDVRTCSNCEKEVKYTWNIYDLETVYDVVTRTVTVDVYKTIDVYEEQEVPVYGYRTVKKEVETPIYTEYQIPEYGDVKYYRYRDCTVEKGTVDIQWSYSDADAELLKKGYKLTGNVKKA